MIRDKFPNPKRDLTIYTQAREADLIKMYLNAINVNYEISCLKSDRKIWIKDLKGVDIETINRFLELINEVEWEFCHAEEMKKLSQKKKHWWNF
jgi:hypothetical protein